MLAQTVAGLRHFGVIDSLRSTIQRNYLIEFPAPSPLRLLQPVAWLFSIRFYLHIYVVVRNTRMTTRDSYICISHLITWLFLLPYSKIRCLWWALECEWRTDYSPHSGFVKFAGNIPFSLVPSLIPINHPSSCNKQMQEYYEKKL